MTAAVPFDEMGVGTSAIRPIYRQIARWLEETPPEILASRRAQAEYMFRRIGITFGVYGDKDAAERLIPFDIVPRVISRAEWTRLEAGLVQRVTALNLFLKDVYGARAILKENIIPVGATVTIHGHRNKDPKRFEIKTERVTWNGKVFNVYPDRS